jgi:hypothetical protein
MLREAGIVLQENNSLAAGDSTMPIRGVKCNVCFEDFSLSAVSTMDCGHCFCNDCEFCIQLCSSFDIAYYALVACILLSCYNVWGIFLCVQMNTINSFLTLTAKH